MVVNCNICNKSFTSNTGLGIHIREVHEGLRNRNHQCDICQKKFTNPKKLWEHHNSNHETTEEFSCELCGKIFLSSYYLRNHVQNVHGEKKHHCSICDKWFSTKAGVEIHIKGVHNKIRDQYCKICETNYVDLRKHIKRVHEQQKNYNCKLCEQSSSQALNWIFMSKVFMKKQEIISVNYVTRHLHKRVI